MKVCDLPNAGPIPEIPVEKALEVGCISQINVAAQAPLETPGSYPTQPSALEHCCFIHLYTFYMYFLKDCHVPSTVLCAGGTQFLWSQSRECCVKNEQVL